MPSPRQRRSTAIVLLALIERMSRLPVASRLASAAMLKTVNGSCGSAVGIPVAGCGELVPFRIVELWPVVTVTLPALPWKMTVPW
jgi:hypothetical protein